MHGAGSSQDFVDSAGGANVVLISIRDGWFLFGENNGPLCNAIV